MTRLFSNKGNDVSKQSIVIVHPFYSKTRRSGVFRDVFDELQAVLTKHPMVYDEANIYFFSFKGEDIVSGKISLNAVSDELVTRLSECRDTLQYGVRNAGHSRSGEPGGATSSHAIPTQDVGETQRDGNSRSQPKLLFISHSLGAWIVKAALLQKNQLSVSVFKTQGTIFLDAGPSYMDSIPNSFQLVSNRYARGLRDIPDFSNELVRQLKALDEEYKNWVESEYVQQQRLNDGMMEVLLSDHHDLWLCKDATDMGGPKSPALRLKTLFRKLTKIVTTNQTYEVHEHSQLHIDIPLGSVVTTWINDTNARYSQNTILHENVLPTTNTNSSGSDVHEYVHVHSSSQRPTLGPVSWTPRWPAPKRLSAVSRVRTIKPGQDEPYIGSAPIFPTSHVGNSIDRLVRQNIEMGKSFIRGGELDNAEAAFQRVSAILNSSFGRQELSGHSLEVEVQLTCIALYRGNYEKACQRFEVLLPHPIPQELLKHEYSAVIHRWIGVALLHQGKYESAVERFRLILTRFAEYLSDEVQIRRDLALASAYLGNFDEAFGELKNAFESLKILEQRHSSERKACSGSTNVQREATSTQSEQSTTISRVTDTGHQESVSTGGLLERLPTESELRAQRDGLYLTQAKLGFAWGSFDRALESSEQALIGMRKRLGPGHLKTLECASLNAILLALNSQTKAAETACVAIQRAMTTELGSEHPLTLEAMGYLVRIYQMQSRFLEAVDTAKSLARIVKSTQTEKRPQALQAMCICAESELKIGNYRTAVFELETIVKLAKHDCKDNRLENLHHETTLALAYYHCGKHKFAESLAARVLRDQLKLYLTRHSHENHDSAKGNKTYEGITSQVAMLMDVASLKRLDLIISVLVEKGFIPKMRPAVLKTLWVVSLIMQEKEDSASLAVAIKLLQALWDRFKNRTEVDSQDALRIRYDLALAIRREAEVEISEEDGDKQIEKRLEEASRHLRHIYRSRSRVLGDINPETLSAKLEFIVTNCTLGRWEEIDDSICALDGEEREPALEKQEYCPLDPKGWALVQSESRKISDLLEAQLGENHPETLKSLVWVLAVQTLLRNKTAATRTSEQILKRLRLKIVRGQRPVESVNLERKLALIVSEISKERAGDILRETEKAIRDCQPWMPEKWRMLEKMVHEERQHLENIN